eukprot:m.125690 g.125690  ORF g.125690 m.125690 type:complete len:239 (+) comp37877_c0_seq62:3397-4113(+)
MCNKSESLRGQFREKIPERQRNVSKSRTVLTDEQLLELESIFEITTYPTREVREALSAKLRLPQRKIQVWFQNRRAKIKRENFYETRKLELQHKLGVVEGAPCPRRSPPSPYCQPIFPHHNQYYGTRATVPATSVNYAEESKAIHFHTKLHGPLDCPQETQFVRAVKTEDSRTAGNVTTTAPPVVATASRQSRYWPYPPPVLMPQAQQYNAMRRQKMPVAYCPPVITRQHWHESARPQ